MKVANQKAKVQPDEKKMLDRLVSAPTHQRRKRMISKIEKRIDYYFKHAKSCRSCRDPQTADILQERGLVLKAALKAALSPISDEEARERAHGPMVYEWKEDSDDRAHLARAWGERW